MKQICILFLLAGLALPSIAADAALRKFISKGMNESEVIAKIGRPDNENETSGGGAQVIEKIWTYLPAGNDPQALTTIVIKNGKVISVERSVSR